MNIIDEKKILDISYVLRDLLKVIKVVSMYPDSNPLPASLKRSFSDKLISVIDDHGDLSFSVDKNKIFYEEQVVFESSTEESNLAGIFFVAGITEFSMHVGLEHEEIYKFLDALKCYINSPNETQDLLTLFWEAEISHVKLKMLEDVKLNEYDNHSKEKYLDTLKKHFAVVPDSNEQELSDTYHEIFIDSEEEYEQYAEDDNIEVGSVDLDASEQDFSSSPVDYYEKQKEESSKINLPASQETANEEKNKKEVSTSLILNDEYRLTYEEEKAVLEIISADTAFEPYESTAMLLKEMVLQEYNLKGILEMITVCEKIINEFIAQSHISEAAQILKFLKHFGDKIKDQKPKWSEQIKITLATSGSSERLHTLTNTLNSNPNIKVTDIEKYFELLGWESFRNISEIKDKIENEQYRKYVTEYLIKNGSENIDILSSGLYDKNIENVLSTISLLARIDNPKIIPYLAKMTDHNNQLVRLVLMKALKQTETNDALPIIKRGIFDEEPDVRNEAVKSIVNRKSAEAYITISEIVKDSNFKYLDINDQSKLLQSFSKLGGEQAVSHLLKQILRFNLFGKKQLKQLRKTSLSALSFNNSEKSERAFKSLSQNWRPSLRKLSLKYKKQHLKNNEGNF